MSPYEFAADPVVGVFQLVLLIMIMAYGLAFMIGGPKKANKVFRWMVMNIIIWPILRVMRWVFDSLLKGTGHGRRRGRGRGGSP